MVRVARSTSSFTNIARRRSKARLGEKLGSVYLFLKDEPQSTRAWKTGSDGEERLARFFEKELPESAIVLHDRRVPGSRANIDHIVVAPSGVWVIDAKAYGGKVERRTIGSIWNAQNRVFVAGRDRTKLVLAMPRQLEATLVGAGCGVPLASEVTVRAAVCFVSSDWGFFAKPFELHGVAVIWPQKLAVTNRRPWTTDADGHRATREPIAVALPPAPSFARDRSTDRRVTHATY